MRYTKSVALLVTGLGIAIPAVGQQAVATSVTLPPDGTAMVFVNTGAIVPVAPGAEAAQAAFEAELVAFRDELDALIAQIDSMVVEYRRQEALLDPTAKGVRQQEIIDLQQAASERQAQLEAQSETRRTELLKPIIDNVRATIEEMRAERRYLIVLDIAESGVIAADSTLDITDAVLERLGVVPEETTDGSGF